VAKKLKFHLPFIGQLPFSPNLNLIALFALLVTLTVTISLRIVFGSTTLYLPVPWYYPWVLAVPQLILLLFVVSISKDDRKLIRAVLHIPNSEGWLRRSIVTVLASIVAIFLYSFTIYKIDVSYLMPPQVPKNILGENGFMVVNLFAIVVWVPFVEELFFRGFLLTSWVAKYGQAKSILLVSLVFMFVHSHPGLYFPVFMSSVLISYLFIKTKSLWPAFVSHASLNLLVVIVAASA
jgi:membrane protease YdiL (CAAX protease family)